MEIILITGMSGSGKSVVLHALEDAGFYCIDNLPPELLQSFIALDRQHLAEQRIAIAMDVRSANSLPLLPLQLAVLQQSGVKITPIFLDATSDILVRRFSETRRRHPLAQSTSEPDQQRLLIQAIELERELLANLREQAHVIDTSLIRSSQLQQHVKDFVAVPANQLTLIFQSFGFKRGVPMDADFVFDVRMLPNPFYEAALRPLTGRDSAVQTYLQEQPTVLQMQTHIHDFLSHWLPDLVRNQRSYVTVAIGCTGGQHRSVYLVEQLAQQFSANWITLKRHREIL